MTAYQTSIADNLNVEEQARVRAVVHLRHWAYFLLLLGYNMAALMAPEDIGLYWIYQIIALAVNAYYLVFWRRHKEEAQPVNALFNLVAFSGGMLFCMILVSVFLFFTDPENTRYWLPALLQQLVDWINPQTGDMSLWAAPAILLTFYIPVLFFFGLRPGVFSGKKIETECFFNPRYVFLFASLTLSIAMLAHLLLAVGPYPALSVNVRVMIAVALLLAMLELYPPLHPLLEQAVYFPIRAGAPLLSVALIVLFLLTLADMIGPSFDWRHPGWDYVFHQYPDLNKLHDCDSFLSSDRLSALSIVSLLLFTPYLIAIGLLALLRVIGARRRLGWMFHFVIGLLLIFIIYHVMPKVDTVVRIKSLQERLDRLYVIDPLNIAGLDIVWEYALLILTHTLIALAIVAVSKHVSGLETPGGETDDKGVAKWTRPLSRALFFSLLIINLFIIVLFYKLTPTEEDLVPRIERPSLPEGASNAFLPMMRSFVRRSNPELSAMLGMSEEELSVAIQARRSAFKSAEQHGHTYGGPWGFDFTPEERQAHDQFAKDNPELYKAYHQIAGMDFFQYPTSELKFFERPVPEYYMLREIARNLAIEAEVLFGEGDLRGALELSLVNLRFGMLLEQDGCMNNRFIGVAICGIALEEMKLVLARSDLKQEDCEYAFRELRRLHSRMLRGIDLGNEVGFDCENEQKIKMRLSFWVTIATTPSLLRAGTTLRFRASEYDRLMILCAARLYEYEHGDPPGSMDDLIPNFFSMRPKDPHFNKPYTIEKQTSQTATIPTGEYPNNWRAKEIVFIRQPDRNKIPVWAPHTEIFWWTGAPLPGQQESAQDTQEK